MLKRTTVVLPQPLKELVLAKARQQGISFAEFVRRALENQVTAQPNGKRSKRKTGDPFWDNLVIYDSGPTDSSVRHDDYIYGVAE